MDLELFLAGLKMKFVFSDQKTKNILDHNSGRTKYHNNNGHAINGDATTKGIVIAIIENYIIRMVLRPS